MEEVEEEVIAALYVMTNGCYFGLPNVDPWDKTRDARLYAGPHRVVAHPPCHRWGKMWFGQPLAISKGAEKKKLGDDGGCFESALKSVRRWGGVLEHPAGSHAWKHFNLDAPRAEGGWYVADNYGGMTCYIEQGRYGHYARKATWLYTCGCDLYQKLPDLNWGISEPKYDPAVIERMGLKRAKRLGEVGAKGGGTDSKSRIATPEQFRDLLISIAES